MDIETKEHTCFTEGCGLTFWITDGFDARMRETHRVFHCPNGHTLVYPGETDAQKLRKERAEKAALQEHIVELETKKRRPRKPAKKAAKK